VARLEYLLELEGMRKEGEHKQQAPPELLEEVFELNESLDELREAKASGNDLGLLRTRLEAAEKNFQEKLGEVDAQLQEAAQQWDAAVDANAGDTGRKGIMARLNELLNRRSYIRNLVANVQKELL
jgi:molecular chaperone HscB